MPPNSTIFRTVLVKCTVLFSRITSIKCIPYVVFGRRFVKRFALCCQTVVCLFVLSCLSVCDVGVLWPNGWTDQDETWRAGRPQPWPHFVRWGPTSPPQKGGGAPEFSAHVCCGQMAAWIKMPLGMEIGLGPSDFVLDDDPAPSQKRGQSPPPIFGPCLLWPNGWMDQGGTWHGGGPRSRPHCARWGPSSPSPKGAQPPNFRPMSVVAKRLDGLRCHLVWR